MKKRNLLFYALALLLVMLCNANFSYGQASSGTANFPGSFVDYLGWSTGSSASLTVPWLVIQNEDANHIKFYTNAGTAGALANLRMEIYDTNISPLPFNSGFVGIGNFDDAPGSPTPQQLLHILDNGNKVAYEQWTNSVTGHTATNGLLIGEDNKLAELKQQKNASMFFYTQDAVITQIDCSTNTPLSL